MLAALVLALTAAGPARAQQPRDTLMYFVAVMLEEVPHLSVEARYGGADRSNLVLGAPPSARPAGTTVAGLSATDDRGVPRPARRSGASWIVDRLDASAVRYRYRLDFRNRTAPGSTGAGLDTLRLYAVTRSVFVAPDPVALRKTHRAYPIIRVRFVLPPGWRLVTSWDSAAGEYHPADGDELLGATIAAAPDFRFYGDSVPGAAYLLAIRGHRYFPDSALTALIRASLRKGAEAFGPVPVARVTYTSDLGAKGRTSGSLQGVASIGLIWEPSEILELARSHDTFHETLHLWFGGAADAERWWMEGVTDYFAARLYSEWKGRPEDLAALCYESYRNYVAIPHATRITMAQESRRNPGGDNTELLIYRKGMLAGLLLDAALRRATDGGTTLDEVARRLLALAAVRPNRGTSEADLRDIVAELGGRQTARVWDRVVAGTDLLSEEEITQALRTVTGRNLEPPPPQPKRHKALSTATHR